MFVFCWLFLVVLGCVLLCLVAFIVFGCFALIDFSLSYLWWFQVVSGFSGCLNCSVFQIVCRPFDCVMLLTLFYTVFWLF